MHKSLVVAVLALVVAGGVRAADDNPPPGDAPSSVSSDLDARLEVARKRLEEAAHEFAELSAQIGAPLVQRLMTLGDVPPRAIVGVQLDPTPTKGGARIQDVSPGGPAAEAGLRAGDIIVAVNGTDVTAGESSHEVVRLMRAVAPASKVRIRVLRDGKGRDFVVMARPASVGEIGSYGPSGSSRWDGPLVGGRDAPMIPGRPGAPPMFDFRYGPQGPLGGLELVNLTPRLGSYFGTEKGVLVVRAPAGLKLEDGDVILAIDGREPTSAAHAARILHSYSQGEKLMLRVQREHQAITVQATVPQPTWGTPPPQPAQGE